MSIETILFISFLIISILGSIFHFTHNWVKRGIILHLISAVNESTWDHMKLLIVLTMLTIFFQYLMFRNIYTNFCFSVLILLIIETITLPLVFEPIRIIQKNYSIIYNNPILSFNHTWISISILCISDIDPTPAT